MDTNVNMKPEKMQQAHEKAKRELQEKLSKMSPEERAAAQARAQQAMQDDAVAMQQLIDDAAKVAAGAAPATKPKFCGNCGAPAGNGQFCAYCGSPLN